MLINSKLALISMLMGVAGLAAAQCSSPSGCETATSISVTPVSNTVRTGSPVLVDVVMKNESKQDVSMPGAMPEDFYRVHVLDADGKAPVVTKFGFYRGGQFDLIRKFDTRDVDMRYLNFNAASFTLNAGQSFTTLVDASKSYDLTEPGMYTITLEHRDPVSQVQVKSNPVTVTVLPAQPSPSEKLTEVASGLGSFSLSIDRVDHKGSSPIWVHLVTKNISDHRILLRREEREEDSGLLGPVFRIETRDGKGAAPNDTELGRTAHNHDQTPPDANFMGSARAEGDLVSIKPGEDWWDTVNVSKLYDLRQPGDYAIQVRRWDDKAKTWVKSNTVTVTLVP